MQKPCTNASGSGHDTRHPGNALARTVLLTFYTVVQLSTSTITAVEILQNHHILTITKTHSSNLEKLKMLLSNNS